MSDSNLLIILIVSLSATIQFVAAVLAIRLINITGRRMTWILISLALALMTIRRVILLYRLLIGEISFTPDLFNEIIALAISVMMAIGISQIAPIFYDRVKTVDSLRRLNRELHAVNSCHQILMRSKDEQSLLNGLCRIICEDAGYRMAWVGYIEHDINRTVKPVAWGGIEDGYLTKANITWADTPQGRGPGGLAIRSRKTACIQDFMVDPHASPWRDAALQRAYRSCIALPLLDDEANPFGILCIYSTKPHAFTPAETRLLEELASDLAFGVTVLRDRNQRKQVEAMRTQMAAIVEFSNDAIVGKNLDGIITHWNKSAERIFGYCAEEIIGRHCATLASPKYRTEIYHLLEKIRNGETVVNQESERIHRDGHLIHVALTLSPIRNAEGQITGISAIERDITEHKLAEERLRHSEHGLAEAQRIAHLGNWELDLVHDRLIWSDEIYRIFEIDPQRFGASYEAFLDRVHPDDRELVNQAYTKSVENKQPYDIVHRLLMSDGRIKYVNEKCETCYDEDGTPLRSTGTVHDITALYTAQLKLTQLSLQNKLILDSAGEGIYGLDIDGKCTFANPAASQLLGYDINELIGQHSHTMFHHTQSDGSPYPLEQCPVHAAYKQHEVRRGQDLYWRKDGSGIPVEFVSTPIMVNGKSQGAVVMFNDITERKRAEEELRRYKDHLEDEVQQRTADLVLARNAAEAANQAKSAFLANMSHELRTPLNAILGFSTMLRKDPSVPKTLQEKVDIINRSGEHLLTLINDVLEMSKIEAGRVQLEHTAFDLGGLVRDVTDMMQIRAEEKGLQLIVDQSSRFPRYIVGDEARMRQILINLLGNAIKFTEQGGVTLRLGTKKNKVTHLKIEVEDSGPGIPAEDQPRIFEPFVQLNDNGTNKGTGLGLSITRQFVEMMGGIVSLQSSLEKGSLFRVELPLDQATESEIVKPKQTEQGMIVGLEPGQPEVHILIVEDQRDNQLLLTQLMENIGLPVKLAENGEEAVQLFQSWLPDLIWMDRRMPVMDGIEATRRIRNLPGGQQVKIIAVTASAFSEQRTEMINAGMDDFVRKPYRSAEIYECLTKHLGIRFIFEDHDETQQPTVKLTPEMLSVLPNKLRADLEDALEKLDADQIELLIEQVTPHDSTLKKTLSHYAENFDYISILNALRAS